MSPDPLALRTRESATDDRYPDGTVSSLVKENIAAELTVINHRLDGVRTRLLNLEQHALTMDNRFDKIDDRFDKIDDRIDKIDDRIENMQCEMNTRFTGMEARFMNRYAQDAWDDIQPVQYTDKDVWKWHPDKVVKLWHLQYVRTHRHLELLVTMIRYYDISDWANWGHQHRWSDCDSDSEEEEEELNANTNPISNVHDSSDSESSQPSKPALSDVVAQYPQIAIQKLCQRLGINFEKMAKKMRVHDAKQARKQKDLAKKDKRKQDLDKLGRNTRQRADRPNTEELVSKVERQPIKENSPPSHELGWKGQSSNSGHEYPMVRDASYYADADAEPCKSPSAGSTVPLPTLEMETFMAQGLHR